MIHNQSSDNYTFVSLKSEEGAGIYMTPISQSFIFHNRKMDIENEIILIFPFMRFFKKLNRANNVIPNTTTY